MIDGPNSIQREHRTTVLRQIAKFKVPDRSVLEVVFSEAVFYRVGSGLVTVDDWGGG